YLEYKAFLATTNGAATPALNDATFCFNDVDCSSTAATITAASPVCGLAGHTASGPAGMTSYAWGIANGTITSPTNGPNITYTASTTGIVTLTLTVTAPNGCIASGSTPVTVNPLPLSTITISNVQSVAVTGSGTFTLNFNGAQTPPLATGATAASVQAALNALPTIGGVGGSAAVVLNSGVYTVTFGGSLTGPQPEMTTTASAGVTATVKAPLVCPGATNNQAKGPDGMFYGWAISNGVITSATNAQTISYTAGTSGDVLLTLTVTDGNGCSATSAPADVPINTPPPTPTISGDTNGTGTQDQACPEQPLTLHANGATGAVSYQWYENNDTLQGETASTYQAVGAATYYVTATDAIGCTTVQSAGYVVQNPTPHSPFISFRNQASSVTTLNICQGSSQIIDSDSATGIEWYEDGVAIATGGNNQAYTFNSTTAGTHTFTAQLDALGCHSQFGRTVTIIIDALPPTPSISGDTNGTGTQDQACPEQPLTLHANGATGATSYTWYSDNAVIPNETTSTLIMTAVGNISVTATNGSCTTAHSATYVVQNPTPHAPFITFRNQASTV
ncbi:MAG TPA: hypothetical protein VKJ07_00120, partial [Mycobacteriales bacterium]|nr:hypothetical protein [Mycobacteriales bacterium]